MHFKWFQGKFLAYRSRRAGKRHQKKSDGAISCHNNLYTLQPYNPNDISYVVGHTSTAISEDIPVPSAPELPTNNAVEDEVTCSNQRLELHTVDPIKIESIVSSEKTDKVVGKKHAPAKFYSKGLKRSCVLNNRKVDEEEDKPIFIYDPQKTKTRAQFDPISNLHSPIIRVKDAFGKTDIDVTEHLKTFASFQPRDTRLLLTLKNRGQRYMNDFNMERYTAKEQRQILMNAVTEAMKITDEEEYTRKLLRQRAVLMPIRRHAEFIRKGKLSFGCFPFPWFSRHLPMAPKS